MPAGETNLAYARGPDMKFRAQVIPSGNANAVEIPTEVVQALGSGPRPLIALTINGHAWRTRVASMRGQPQ
jgi:hypothetical protein